ncbi:MAG: type I restriction endonuclease subunit S [Proteobacteria bacterium]|nr:MAG: type I restriction endonuclease subunit S [Pseudomonadota bacterium]
MSELYQLPDGWEWVEWDGIVDIKNGKHYKDVINPDGKYPIYGSGGVINFADEYLCNEDSVIIGRKGTINNPIFVKEKFWNIDTAFGLEANRNLLVPMFLYYFTQNFNFLDLNTATTMPSLTKSNLQKIKMPLPPLTEQKRIVQKLNALFERIDKAIVLLQKNIDAADSFMNSVLNDVFSNLEQNYGTQNILDGVNIGSRVGYKPTLIDGKVPFIGMSDIDEKSGINTKYVLEDYEKVSKGKVKFERNAVLVGKITPCTQNNKTTIVPTEIDGGFATTEVYALHSKENMYPFYLNYFMRSKNVNDYLVSTMVGATGRQRVPSESIRALKISIPTIDIQKRAVLYFDNISAQIEQVKSAQQQKMQNFLDLKSSILDQAFHGKL